MSRLTRLVANILANGSSSKPGAMRMKVQDAIKPPLAATALALVTFLVSTGCNPTNDVVTISYEQVGACNGFNAGGGITSAGPNAAYVVFRITTIENKDSAARDFNFDPNRVFVNTSPRAYTDKNLNLAQINPFYATSRFVAKGTTAPANVGAVIAVVSTVAADGASEAKNTSYFLLYDVPSGGQGVNMVKMNLSQTSWPSTPDCTNIIY